MYNIKILKKDLKSILSKYRYEHSIMVAKKAKKLAKYYKIDEKKAYTAGLLHDIAKEFSNTENQKWLEKYNISNNFQKTLHAEIGACYVKEKYNLDEDICNAIKYHTTGNVSMDLLAKIIFIADKVGRKNKSERIKKIETISYNDIDKAIIFHLNCLKEKLTKENKEMQKDSLLLLDTLTNNNKTQI